MLKIWDKVKAKNIQGINWEITGVYKWEAPWIKTKYALSGGGWWLASELQKV